MSDSFDRLRRLADRLLGPDGCPWDKVQTPLSLSGYLVEEASEAAQAIVEEDPLGAREELGDLLYLIVFVSRLYENAGRFDLDQVARTVETKMIRRHPHIFGDDDLETPKAVKDNWDRIKRVENGPEGSLLDSVPKSLPGLPKAHRLSQRAASIGFDWGSAKEVLDKVEEELNELKAALKDGSGQDRRAEELGDLFFSLANLARHLGLNPETVVQQANTKFTARFQSLEESFRSDGRDPAETGQEELDSVWEEIKKRR